MRLSLGLLFLCLGFGKLLHPEQWVFDPMAGLVERTGPGPLPLPRFLTALAIVEIVLGVHIMANLFVRAAAFLGGLKLVITLCFLNFDPSTLRDLALMLGLGAPLVLWPPPPGRFEASFRSLQSPLRQSAWLGLVIAASVFVTLRFASRPSGPERTGATTAVMARIGTAETAHAARKEPIKAIPESLPVDPRQAKLGRRLFHDPLLSRDRTISCSTCHDPTRNGADQDRFSAGVDGRKSLVNTPTVFNAVFNDRQFWDGRAEDLRSQIDGPVRGPDELDLGWPELIRRLSTTGDYPEWFARAFPGSRITQETISDALAAYQATLITPGSPFDAWLSGDDQALSTQERAGYDRFKAIGCVACHQGVNVGGNMFQTMGRFGNYFEDRGGPLTSADLGRFNVTGLEADRHRFKVPGLRNVARTAPYFHDGSVATLEEAVKIMARYQLGRTLDTEEIGSIVLFLQSLNGRRPDDAQR